MRFLIVNASFYVSISALLQQGADECCAKHGLSGDTITVGGALEIPPAIAIASASGRYDGFVALGCVIRGETSHYDIVAAQSAAGLMQLGIQHRLAIGNGILTVENEAQAIVRAHPQRGNKGAAAVLAALELARLKQSFQQERAA